MIQMSFDIALTGQKRPIAIVKVWDRENYLRREVRFHGDGKISYRERNRKDIDMTFGWVNILDPIEDLAREKR